jgi:hypothetical protein
MSWIRDKVISMMLFIVMFSLEVTSGSLSICSHLKKKEIKREGEEPMLNRDSTNTC